MTSDRHHSGTDANTGNVINNGHNKSGIKGPRTSTPFEMLKQKIVGVATIGNHEALAQFDRLWAMDAARASDLIRDLGKAINEELSVKRTTLKRLTDHMNRRVREGREYLKRSITRMATSKLCQKQIDAVMAVGTPKEKETMGAVVKVHQLIGIAGTARLDGKINMTDRNWRLLGTLVDRCQTASIFFDRLQWGYSKLEEDRRKKHTPWTPSLVIKCAHIEAAIGSFKSHGAPGLGRYSTPIVSKKHYDVPKDGLGPFLLRRDMSTAREGGSTCRFDIVGAGADTKKDNAGKVKTENGFPYVERETPQFRPPQPYQPSSRGQDLGDRKPDISQLTPDRATASRKRQRDNSSSPQASKKVKTKPSKNITFPEQRYILTS